MICKELVGNDLLHRSLATFFFSPSDEIYDEISGVDFVRRDPLTPTRPALYGQFYGHHGLVGIQTNGCPYEEES